MKKGASDVSRDSSTCASGFSRDLYPYLLSGLSGLLFYFVFPNPTGLQLWPLAWVMLVPLIYALLGAQSPRSAAKIAGAAGLIGYPLFYHWLVYCMHMYGSMSYPVSIFVLLALVMALAAFLLIFGAAFHLFTRVLHLSPLVAAPVIWVAIDLLRGHFPFGGFPWALLCYSQTPFPPIIQISEFTGPYGVTFLIVLANAAIAMCIKTYLSSRPNSLVAHIGARVPPPAHSAQPLKIYAIARPLLIGLTPALLALIYGLIRIPMVDAAFRSQPEIKVGVVQANIDQGLKWDENFFWQSMDAHLTLTQQVMKDQPRLVLWPEAAVTAPGGFNRNWDAHTAVILHLSQVRTYLLTGALSYEPCDHPSVYPNCAYNSVYLLTPGAESIAGRYDKIHLVPFGEYVPLARLFFFASAIAKGNTGGTTAGDEVKLLSLPEAHFGCVVCYEVIFPELVRRFVKEGAAFMTTVTNDAWFGKTGAPYQHHANVVFRAVENRVYFVRAANTGISSIVDPAGRIIHATGIYVPASFSGVVRPSPLHTFYTAFGDLFAYANAILFIAALAAALYRARASRATGL